MLFGNEKNKTKQKKQKKKKNKKKKKHYFRHLQERGNLPYDGMSIQLNH